MTFDKSLQRQTLRQGQVGKRMQDAGHWVDDTKFAIGVGQSACTLQPVGDELNLAADSTPLSLENNDSPAATQQTSLRGCEGTPRTVKPK